MFLERALKFKQRYHHAAKRIFDIMAHFDAIGERGERCPQLLLEVRQLIMVVARKGSAAHFPSFAN